MPENGLPMLEGLQVSRDGHFLETASGRPFFWLGDTAWELFHRLKHEEVVHYLDNRQARRFNLIQAVALAEFDGLTIPNAYGDLPLVDLDPTRPNPAYFAFVDEVIHAAADRGLYLGLLPTWGDKVAPMWGKGPAVFTPENARIYGRWLGQRYRETTNLVWIIGGDRPAVNPEGDYRPTWRALVEGIREGVGGPALMTYHPNGRFSSSQWLHGETWLDVNMLQSGHGSGRDTPTWELVSADYRRSPARPVLDGEPNYEDHPVNPWPAWDPANGYYRDYDVRKQVYRSVFAGGCGVTYGHHSVWQFLTPERVPITHPDRGWLEGLERPGGAQVQHLRALVESRPPWLRRPDQSLLASPEGSGAEHIQAARGANGSYALVYLPGPRPVEVHMESISGVDARAWWFDPRCGEADQAGVYPTSGTQVFVPPATGPDWVLVLDDDSRGFNRPGKHDGKTEF